MVEVAFLNGGLGRGGRIGGADLGDQVAGLGSGSPGSGLSLGLGGFLCGLALGLDASRLFLSRLLFRLRLGSCLLGGFAIGLGLGGGFLGRLAICLSPRQRLLFASSAAFAASSDCSAEPVSANDVSPDDPEQPINPPKHSAAVKTHERTFSHIETLLISLTALPYF